MNKITRFVLASSLLTGLLQVREARAQSGTWLTASGGSWSNSANWSNSIIASGSGDTANFSTLLLGSAPTVTLDSGATTIGNMIFGDTGNAFGWTLSQGSGGSLTLAGGTPTITVENQSATIGFALGGTAGLTKAGAGTLVLTGAETYTGNTTISAGALTLSGASSGSTPANYLYVGGATGNGVLNFNTSGTWNIAVTADGVFVGGTGVATDTGAGAINQSAGTLNCMLSGDYMDFGDGSATAYGSYNLSGGALNVSAGAGMRIGDGGLGSWVQSGGALSCGRYFVVGANNTLSGDVNKGVATFTGGTAVINGSYYIILGNTSAASGVLNIGTEAGGNAVVTTMDTANGPFVGQVAGATGALNINSGVLAVASPIQTASGGTGTVNLDGGTIRAYGVCNLINTTPTSVNVYNGGVILDSQAFTGVTLTGKLLATSGSGIYPAGGIETIATGGGAGYIGLPLVTVSGGSGSGALAIANISGGVVTGLTITCPGQNYLVGDNLSFAFAGGGPTTPASTFHYTLQSSDLAFNTTGGVTKISSGSLTLSGASTYIGGTTVSAGTLAASAAGSLGSGNVTVAGGATLTLSGAYITSNANVVVNPTSTVNLNFSGSDTVFSLSLNGGTSVVAPGVYGSATSGAANVEGEFAGTGTLTVTAANNNNVGVKLSSYTAAQNVYAGQTAVYSAILSLGVSPTYQWEATDGATYTNSLTNGPTGTGSTIAGATSPSLTISTVSTADTTNYYTCVCSNQLPSVTNTPLAPLTLLVSTGVLITRPGDSITDFTGAIGTPDPYTGLPASQIIDGSLAPYLNYGENGPSNTFSGPVGFVVAPSIGASVVTAARIYTSAVSTNDDPADFTLYGSPDGVNWTLIHYTPVTLPFARNAAIGTINSNSDVLIEVDFPNTNAYYTYAAYFTNIVSDAALNGIEFGELQLLGTTTNMIAPGIVAQPSPLSQTRLAGGSASFSLTAEGPGTLTYQWFEGSTNNPIALATNASYTVTGLTTAMSGNTYFCIVGNSFGSITSSSVTLTVLATTPAQSLTLSYNPVAYWPLNETSGTTAFDYAGYNNGTYTGGCVLGQTGVPTNAGFGTTTSVLFNGTSSYVTIPVGDLNITGAITLIEWIKTTETEDEFLTSMGHSDSSYRFDVDQTGFPHFADTAPDVIGTVAVNNGVWHQFVGVYNGATSEFLYVDGVLVASSTASTPPVGSPDPVFIGGDPQYSPGSRLFPGNIAQVAILTNALTATQVAALFDVGLPPTITSQPPLLSVVPAGTPMTFSVTLQAGSPGPFTYQWSTNGVPDTSTNGVEALYAFDAALGTNTYEVSVSNLNGTVSSSLATVVGSTNPPPVVTLAESTNWTLNKSGANFTTAPEIVTNLNNGEIELTDGGGTEFSSGFFDVGQYIGGFVASFTYLPSPSPGGADGVTFCLQDATAGTNALGTSSTGGGGGLGYDVIPASFAFEINIYAKGATGNGPGTTGDAGIAFGTNGATPTSTTPAPINGYYAITPASLTNNLPIYVQLYYSQNTLQVWMINSNLAQFTTNISINLPSVLGNSSAYVGFTGADGGVTSTQWVSDFTFTSTTPPTLSVAAGATPGTAVVSWPISVSSLFQLLQASSLNGPWTPVGIAPTPNGSLNQVTVTPAGATAYYELQLTAPTAPPNNLP